LSTVLITGATRGIGRATALLFAKAGWDLLLASRDEKALKSLVKELENLDNKVFYVSVDFSNSDEIDLAIEELLSHGLSPNVLINNAGVAWTGDLLNMPLVKWQWIVQLNITSIFQICKKVVPVMRKNGGLVINVSSHASRNAFPQWGAYCVTKAALASFTKCLAEEERKFSVRACTLTLGSVNSTIWDTSTVQSSFNRNAMLHVDQAAKELLHLAEQPSTQIIEDLTLMPSAGVL
tara:strand:- start:7703 stop:8410 length:708 start_codon:yes stop_codon:yes gene_type:complete